LQLRSSTAVRRTADLQGGCALAALTAAALLMAGCATQLADSGVVGPDGSSGKVIEFQRESLTPTDGGRLVRPEELLAGDILLSADPGLASAGIRLLTTSPVSHAAIYVGNGEVAEALRGGVRLRSIDRVLKEETVVAAFRHPLLDEAHAQRMTEFAREQVGKPYDFVGVVMHAPFALQRRVCELPGVPTLLREACLSTLATLQLIHGGDDRFFCSQFVLESYRAVGLPITRARPHWVSPEDIMHMRAGDVSSLPVEQPLIYVGHLKFTELALPLPGLWIPLPLPPSGEARTPVR
jgi:cell wall-associated NlpC family hydrolase